MQRLIALIFSVVLLGNAYAADLSGADKQAFKSVIGGQLEAFQADDGTKAYSYAAPVVTKIFPNVATFMAMVKRGYDPVFRNSTHIFGALETDGLGRPAQHVLITAADGKRYEAVYFMEKQADGSWKIAGVQLVLLQGLDA
jgi:ketosteroid isomerase-like protein